MIFFFLFLLESSSENDINYEGPNTKYIQSESTIISFIRMIYFKIVSIFQIYYKTFTKSPSIKSVFTRYLEIPLNNSRIKTNFTILEQIVEKIYDNKTSMHHTNNNTKDSNTNSTIFAQYPKIQKLEIVNPFQIIGLIMIIQALKVVGLLSNLPFRDFDQLKRYINHLPPGTRKLYQIMCYIHCLSVIMFFIDDDFLVKLFGQSTYLIFGDLQFWRIITGTLLHGDIIHLLSNMFEFILCGPYFEKQVGTDLFYFHIYCISIMISVVEGIIHYFMYIIGFTERIETFSIGFSGVIFALYIISGEIARNKGKSNRRKKKHSRSYYSPINFNYVSSSSSSSSVSPSNLYLVGTRTTYRDFFSNEMVPWYLLFITFILSPSSSFTAHFAGIIVGEIYINYLEPNNLFITNRRFVDKFNRSFPWIVVGYFFFYSMFMI